MLPVGPITVYRQSFNCPLALASIRLNSKIGFNKFIDILLITLCCNVVYFGTFGPFVLNIKILVHAP